MVHRKTESAGFLWGNSHTHNLPSWGRNGECRGITWEFPNKFHKCHSWWIKMHRFVDCFSSLIYFTATSRNLGEKGWSNPMGDIWLQSSYFEHIGKNSIWILCWPTSAKSSLSEMHPHSSLTPSNATTTKTATKNFLLLLQWGQEKAFYRTSIAMHWHFKMQQEKNRGDGCSDVKLSRLGVTKSMWIVAHLCRWSCCFHRDRRGLFKRLTILCLKK